jgi:predicted  nucleic acid-binding Zn-ribbon protein
MASKIQAMLELQSVERKLSEVRARLRTRKRSVQIQERKLRELQEQYDQKHQEVLERRKQADSMELDLKEKEATVNKQRSALNAAKTNKEYASLLKQINTLRADNSRVEEQVLKIISDVEAVQAEAEQIQQQIQAEESRLEEVRQAGAAEIERLEGMIADLNGQRAQAAEGIEAETLAVFDRLAETYDGEAMAMILVSGKKPPHAFSCGGCHMSLSAEHANALATRDEVRTCSSCGRILYLAEHKTSSAKG